MINKKAYAKINWTLDILGKRPDGFHEMDMLMQTVSLCDELTFEECDTLILQAASEDIPKENNKPLSSNPVPYNENNLIFRSAKALRKQFRIHSGAKITLKKVIPSGAGLGGGSADAAVTLHALNEMWKLGLSLQELCDIGKQLGADIPFLLHGGFARVRGLGEIIEQISPPAITPLLIIQPCEGLSTAEVFKAYDRMEKSIVHPDTESAEEAIENNNLSALCKCGGNVLEDISKFYRPEIGEAIEFLKEYGAEYAAMSGSGSAVFAAFSSQTLCDSVYHTLKMQYPSIWSGSTLLR